jgi:hypothetical protein
MRPLERPSVASSARVGIAGLVIAGLFLVLLMLAALSPGSARASFGLSTFDVTFTNHDGSPATQAGSHPFALTTTVYFNLLDPTHPDGEVKDVIAEQIAGLVADPNAVPRCSTVDFLRFINAGPTSGCPNSTAVGFAATDTVHLTDFAPVFNLQPPPGVVLKLGFIAANTPVTIEVGLKDHSPYNGVAVVSNIPQSVAVRRSVLTLWGDPSDPAHDPFRGVCVSNENQFDAEGNPLPELVKAEYPSPPSYGDCSTSTPDRPFLTLPRACEGPLATTYATDSWQNPGGGLANGEVDLSDPAWVQGSVLMHDNGEPADPLGLSGCSRLGFAPTTGVQPTTGAASSSTGLSFDLDVHNEGLTSSTGLSQSDIRKTVVTLPEAVSVNPALAEGLGACSEGDLQRETIHAAPGEGCPEESKIGTVEVDSPLIDHTLKGSLFLATQGANPFGSLLALYVVIKDPETGILIKLPGKVEPNPVTGQLVSVFDDLPQLPFSHFHLSFRQGQRSPLVTPQACGTYTTHAELTPWAGGVAVDTTSSFQVTSGIAGGPCPPAGAPPFAPGVIAGTLNNSAGAFSPLDVRITRNDNEQEITGFSTKLPPGVSASLTGVPFCPETAIALAKTKTGAQEETEPSCPAASQIGHTLVGVGVGSVLAYTPGKIYMGGPFQGAPFSIISITSAKVGPFDLGTVVVHLPLQIDPRTAAVNVTAGGPDQIPHIVDGIVVHVRDIRVYVDRPGFTFNPTSCEPLTFAASVIGSGADFANPADDTPFAINDHFQATNCAALAFKPSFNVTTSGKTSKANGASLTVKLAYPNAPQGTQANIRSVKVELPKQLPSRLTTLQKACTAAQFDANPAGCPAASVIGHAKAITPILPVPLEGPAYFVSNGGEAFPNLIMVLQGYGLTIDLTGNTFINKAGVTSSTFPAIPDQPVTSFELTLPEGPNSALAANGNLCTSKLTTPNEFIGQNGATFTQNTKVTVTGCPKAKVLTRAQKLALALKACHKKSKGAKRKACERTARKKYGPVKKKAKKAKK